MEKIQFSERDGGSKVKFATCISVFPKLHYINQMKGLTKEDKLMLRQAYELIETKFLNKLLKRREIKDLD